MPVRYALDPTQGRFTVKAFATGMLSLIVHNPTITARGFAGSLTFDPAAPQDTAFDMAVRADSLAVTADAPPKDRPEIEAAMRRQVLEADKHPQITFRSTGVTADRIADDWFRLRIRGTLALRGVPKPLEVDTPLRLVDGGAQVRLSGSFTVSQTAFGIKPVSAVGGMIKLKDELQLSFDLVGRKAEG